VDVHPDICDFAAAMHKKTGVLNLRNYWLQIGGIIALSFSFPALASAQAKSKPPQLHLPHIQGQAGHLNVVNNTVDLDVDENVIVRKKYPPDQYDANGKARKPTIAELTEFKGPDKTLPFYKGEIFDLKNGQVVEVKVYKKKDDSKKSADKPAADAKSADKPDTKDWVFLGTMTGSITSYKSSDKLLTLKVQSATPAAGKHHNVNTNKGKNNKLTLPDTKVTMVVVLSKDQPEKDTPAAKKKNNN
jgi:hypothetical protein